MGGISKDVERKVGECLKKRDLQLLLTTMKLLQLPSATNSGKENQRKAKLITKICFHGLKVILEDFDVERFSLPKTEETCDIFFHKISEAVMNLPDIKNDIQNKLGQCCCQLAFKLHKAKLVKNCLCWIDRSFQLLTDQEIIKKQGKNFRWMVCLKAECLCNFNSGEDALQWLASVLTLHPDLFIECTMSYDLYEQIPWTDFSTHWITSYKHVISKNPNFRKTTLDYINEDDLSDELKSKILRLELNSHFTGRHGIPQGLCAVGEALVERSTCPYDNLMGFIAIVISCYLGSAGHIDHALDTITDAVQFLESEDIFRKEKKLDMTNFVSAILSIWRGLCVMKKQQYFVEAEMECLKKELSSENSEKYSDIDKDTGEDRGVSGFAELTLGHEKDWVTSLIFGVEILYRYAYSKDLILSFSKLFCPALIMVSVRLCSCLLMASGSLIYAAKSWYVVNVLAQVYDKKGLLVQSASEILKIVPDVNSPVISIAETANSEAIKKNLIRHNVAISYRLALSKSWAYYNTKSYNEGIELLLKVFHHIETRKDNFDSTHLLLGEASFLLALYRNKSNSHEIDLSEFPESLRLISPAGLAVKSFKGVCGMTRDPDWSNSGWTDLLHNFFVMSSVMEIGWSATQLLRDSGKPKELRGFLSDAINFAQLCALYSRAVSLLVPMIEFDIEARNFRQAQMKIHVIMNFYKSSVCEEEGSADEASYEELIKNMAIPKLSLERFKAENDLKWNLKPVAVSSLYYRHRSDKFIDQMSKDMQEGFENLSFSLPSWTKHNLSCSCYTCMHPTILPTLYKFFHSNAMYLNCLAKVKAALAVLETTKLNQEKSVFRLVYNLSNLSMPLTVISSNKKWAFKSVEIMYTPFCTDPALHSIYCFMRMCPQHDLKSIIDGMRKSLLLIDSLDSKDYLGKTFPLDLSLTAIVSHLIEAGKIQIKGSELQGLMEGYQSQEGVFHKGSPPSTPPSKCLYVSEGPMVGKRKDLKVTTRKQRPCDGNKILLDDRPVSHLPVLNFNLVEDEEDVQTSRTLRDHITERSQRRKK